MLSLIIYITATWNIIAMHTPAGNALAMHAHGQYFIERQVKGSPRRIPRTNTSHPIHKSGFSLRRNRQNNMWTKHKLHPIVTIPSVIPFIFSFCQCCVKNKNSPATIPTGQAINQYLSIQYHRLLTLSKLFVLHLNSTLTVGLHIESLLTERILYGASCVVWLHMTFNYIPY